jgi:hypothetical protein
LGEPPTDIFVARISPPFRNSNSAARIIPDKKFHLGKLLNQLHLRAVKWGYLDKGGSWAILPEYDFAGDFSDDLAAVSGRIQGRDEDHWGYIDKMGKVGKVVIPLQFDSALPFVGGLGKVKTNKGWRYIDKQGEFVGTRFLPSPGPVALEGAKPMPH